MHRSRISICLFASALMTAPSGCATYTAVRIPGPVADETIGIGSHRSDVEVVLKRSPTDVYREGDGTIARYQYQDGPPEASKGRVILYLAGDVFTLFLSELIFWPIEAYASGQTQRIATAHYDPDNVLVAWSVDRGNGERLIGLGVPSPASGPSDLTADAPPRTGASKVRAR